MNVTFQRKMSSSTRAWLTILTGGGAAVLVAADSSSSSRTTRVERSVVDSGAGSGGVVKTSSIDGRGSGDTARGRSVWIKTGKASTRNVSKALGCVILVNG